MAKKKSRRGRPPGKKSGKKRGRPPTKGVRAKGKSITLPVGSKVDINYWSDMVVFLNQNKGKSFTVQMDGINYSLWAS